MKRRAFLGMALAGVACGARGAIAPRGRAEDFDALWRAIESAYAYFDAENRLRWHRARERLRPPALRASSPESFVAILQSCIDQLRDDHVTLAGEAIPAARRIPYE